MAVQVNIHVSNSDILRYLLKHGYDIAAGSVTSVRRAVFRIIASDIKSGETNWPVATGYSRGNFFVRGDSLWNHASYVNHIYGGRAVERLQSWVNRRLSSIINAAGEQAGVPRQAKRRVEAREQERRYRRRAQRELDRVLDRGNLRDEIKYADRSRVNTLFELSLRQTLNLERRRRQRFYRLAGFRDFIFSDGDPNG